MSEKRWTIGRPINGVSLNGLEYLCDNAGRQLMYDSEESARADLRRYGYSDKRIEDEGIVICCFNEVDYMASLEKRNAELEAKVAELEEKHWNECGQIARYDDELRKANELLKAAVEDMNKEADCGICLHDNDGECPIEVASCKFKWRYADEALALIGEDTNVPGKEDGE